MPDSFSSDGLRRIRRLAWVVRLLCLLGVAVIGTLPFIFWAQPEWVAEVAGKTWNLSTVQLDLASRLWGLVAMMLPTSVILFALWQMWSLFGCFAQGELLARRPAQHLRRLGLGLCTLAGAQPLGHTLAILALTWGNPKGQRQLWFGLSSDHYIALLFGLLLLALAQVALGIANVRLGLPLHVAVLHNAGASSSRPMPNPRMPVVRNSFVANATRKAKVTAAPMRCASWIAMRAAPSSTPPS